MMEEFEKIAAHARQRQIDKDVFRYIAASERGDFATMAEICQYAEGDSELGEALWDAALELAKDEPPISEETIQAVIRKIAGLEP